MLNCHLCSVKVISGCCTAAGGVGNARHGEAANAFHLPYKFSLMFQDVKHLHRHGDGFSDVHRATFVSMAFPSPAVIPANTAVVLLLIPLTVFCLNSPHSLWLEANAMSMSVVC